VGDFLSQWLKEAAKPKLRPKTYASYAQQIQSHLLPRLGSIRLEKMSPQDVQAFVNDKLHEGLSPRTVHYLRAILRKALNQAMRWELIHRNVATLVEMPRLKAKRSANPFRPEELATLLKASERERLGTLYRTALHTGLRQGELLGLRWKDVDLAAGKLTVTSALQFIEGKFEFVEPKTVKSRRVVNLPDSLTVALKQHRKRQLEERLLAGSQWIENGLVFATSRGTPLDGVNVTKDFQRMLKNAKLPQRRFHDLRHTAATLLMAQNVHPRIVGELLGHTEARTTLDLYSHVSSAMRKEAVGQLDAIIQAATKSRRRR
jgi:integrase